MARPSKLTDKQWETIGKRLLDGEKPSDLAREYGVSKAAISQRFSKRIETVKTVAHQMVALDDAMGKLNVSEQFAARSLSEKLKAMRESMGSAGESLAGIAQRASALANETFQKVNDADPFSEESVKCIKGVGVLLNVANQAAELPMMLIKSAKDMVDPDGPKGGKGEGGIPKAPEYQLVTDEPLPDAPIL
jgi:hypothetical protein